MIKARIAVLKTCYRTPWQGSIRAAPCRTISRWILSPNTVCSTHTCRQGFGNSRLLLSCLTVPLAVFELPSTNGQWCRNTIINYNLKWCIRPHFFQVSLIFLVLSVFNIFRTTTHFAADWLHDFLPLVLELFPVNTAGRFVWAFVSYSICGCLPESILSQYYSLDITLRPSNEETVTHVNGGLANTLFTKHSLVKQNSAEIHCTTWRSPNLQASPAPFHKHPID